MSYEWAHVEARRIEYDKGVHAVEMLPVRDRPLGQLQYLHCGNWEVAMALNTYIDVHLLVPEASTTIAVLIRRR